MNDAHTLHRLFYIFFMPQRYNTVLYYKILIVTHPLPLFIFLTDSLISAIWRVYSCKELKGSLSEFWFWHSTSAYRPHHFSGICLPLSCFLVQIISSKFVFNLFRQVFPNAKKFVQFNGHRLTSQENTNETIYTFCSLLMRHFHLCSILLFLYNILLALVSTLLVGPLSFRFFQLLWLSLWLTMPLVSYILIQH